MYSHESFKHKVPSKSVSETKTSHLILLQAPDGIFVAWANMIYIYTLSSQPNIVTSASEFPLQ